jgi:23S rRNA (cytidine1920-2'-O)/16S rRNA (cytidine1409-2'-O)-methyltransferase
MPKTRLDLLLVERGLVESREKGRRLIGAGQVLVNGHLETKASKSLVGTEDVQLKELPRYVGRGGNKLETAFTNFDFNVDGKLCVDVGASTGGFTDCLLQNGAKQVICVDVGKGQLHWKLRNDPRVIVMEDYNARNMRPEDLAYVPAFCCIDVSFISLRKVLPAVVACLSDQWELVMLIKPQFEAGRENVAKGGVVKDEVVRKRVLDDLRIWCQTQLCVEWVDSCDSGVRGPAGNMEFVAHIKAKS